MTCRRAARASMLHPVELRPKSHPALRMERQKPMIIPVQQKPWAPDELKLLGTKPDDVIGKETGRSFWAVRTRRRISGIPRYVDDGEFRSWTPEQDQLLGTCALRARPQRSGGF